MSEARMINVKVLKPAHHAASETSYDPGWCGSVDEAWALSEIPHGTLAAASEVEVKAYQAELTKAEKAKTTTAAK